MPGESGVLFRHDFERNIRIGLLRVLELLVLFRETRNHLVQDEARFIYNPVQMVLTYLDLGFAFSD